MSEPSAAPSQGTITVRGGTGGITARYDDLLHLAQLSEHTATQYTAITAACHQLTLDDDLTASAALDPSGAAQFEAALLSALDGPHGLTALAAELASQAARLKTTVATYQTTDTLEKSFIDSVAWTLGDIAGEVLPAAAPLAASALAGLAATNPELAAFAAGHLPELEAGAQRFLLDHPEAADAILKTAPGLITGLTGLPAPNVASAAQLVALTYDPSGYTIEKVFSNIPTDGQPVTDGTDPAAKDWSGHHLDRPPRALSDLVSALNERNRSVGDGQDQIDIRVIDDHGKKAYIVDIPGTKSWEAPWDTPGTNLSNADTNVRLLGGETTPRQHALAAAGASPTDPVMLVGHSQGGMLAAQAAADTATGAFPYNVTHVVTAGSPIGYTPIPPTVQVLALENQHDLVPHLDGAANRDQPNITTVTFEGNGDSIGLAHSTEWSYLPGARALDSSTDPSVTTFHASASAFFPTSPTATASHTVYSIKRA